MILRYFISHYHYYWLLLLCIVGVKILLSFFFNKNLEGVSGFLFAIFKWYGESDQEMADTAKARTLMRFYNVLTLFMYLVLLTIIMVSVLPMFITV
jgi:hypothetical protein